MHRFFIAALVCGLAFPAIGEFADYRFIPPGGVRVKAASPMAAEAVAQLKRGNMPAYQIEDYAGQQEALRKSAVHPALQVAVGVDLGWKSGVLFEESGKSGENHTWKAAIGSVDATALRFQVDLSALGPEDAVWVVDTVGEVSHGPYTLADAEGTGRWLPTTMGDMAVIVVTSPYPELPKLSVTRLSHFYEDLAPKGADCPISADCITDPALAEVSTGIGRVSVTDESGSSALCSGALLNNALTDAVESFFLTADHCFQNFPAVIRASGIEVLWDVRTNGCPGTEPTTQEIARSPRSNGSSFIANSASLDAMLLTLGSVPVGDLGRAYLGWDTRMPRIGNSAVGIHHPAGRALKECLGRVDNIGVDSSFGLDQTTIRWTDGITEGGSSGSPVMFNDGDFRVFGMLSNGNFQSCNINDPRLDQYSSFQAFFPSISTSLNSETPQTLGRTTYESTPGPGGGGIGTCVPVARSIENAAGDIALAGLAFLVLLGMGKAQRQRD